jgi:hypothetical protein
VILRYVSEWDSSEIAGDFFRFYGQALRKKWKKMDITAEKVDTISGTGDDGYFVVRQFGAVVSSVEGMASPEQAKSNAMR